LLSMAGCYYVAILGYLVTVSSMERVMLLLYHPAYL
jgi:hypothetical protein